MNLNYNEMDLEPKDLKPDSYRHREMVRSRISLSLRAGIGSLQVGIRACLILGFVLGYVFTAHLALSLTVKLGSDCWIA